MKPLPHESIAPEDPELSGFGPAPFKEDLTEKIDENQIFPRWDDIMSASTRRSRLARQIMQIDTPKRNQ